MRPLSEDAISMNVVSRRFNSKFLEQHASVLRPTHPGDARRLALEALELELLARDDVALRAHLVGEAAVLEQKRPVREHFEDRGLEVRVGPRLAHEAEDACMVDRTHDAVDV